MQKNVVPSLGKLAGRFVRRSEQTVMPMTSFRARQIAAGCSQCFSILSGECVAASLGSHELFFFLF